MEPRVETKLEGNSLSVPSVQELAKDPSLSTVPPRYIRHHQDPPIIPFITSSSLPQVPVIDMKKLLIHLDHQEEFMGSELEKFHFACKDWGFFQLINHGVSSSVMDRMKAGVEGFFNLDVEEKNKFKQKAGEMEGLGQAFVVSEEQKLDWADMFYIISLPTHLRNPHLFPNLPVAFRLWATGIAGFESAFADKELAVAFWVRVRRRAAQTTGSPSLAEQLEIGVIPSYKQARRDQLLSSTVEEEASSNRKRGSSQLVRECKHLAPSRGKKPQRKKIINKQIARDSLEAYSVEVKNIAQKLLHLTTKALKMNPNDMRELIEEGFQSMRMNYYPPCPQPNLVIGLNNHSDAVGLTILLQINDKEGLQIRKDGMWVPIKPLPNAFIVNIGDILEIVTNGIYRSIEHRAIVNADKERLSVATFYSPKLDGELGPAPSLISKETPALFMRIGVADYYKGFFSRQLHGKSYVDVIRIHNSDEEAKI
ncbi:hypothetical protein FNV43_RR06532 [Rhamnella rubrinervis]|uniref:Fe2OG dioxygenase domain-containing protein n=1 Tax=Rhamnella rubrinervis TaxID=2594499 RepID=A0A8K0HEQ7_9ROSA|nr:hypothetical protein FNV43_RR06532 [Rhamnella rubrinervis]